MNWSKPRTSLISKESFTGTVGQVEEQEEPSEEEKERMKDIYLFREGKVPPYRQMFYQYGDIQLQAAHDILAENVGDKCLEKSGWYIPGTEDKLREVLTRSINKNLRPDKSNEASE